MSLTGVDIIILKTVCGSVALELSVFDLLEMQLQNMVINWKFSASLQMTGGIALKSGKQQMQKMCTLQPWQ